MANRRMNHDERFDQLLSAAIRVARKVGYQTMTRGAVATEAGCSAPLLNVYFDGVEAIRSAVVDHAIKSSDLRIIAQLLAVGDARAKRVSKKVRDSARAII